MTHRAVLRRLACLLFFAVVLALAPGCSSCGKKGASDKPRIVVSIFPIYDLVRRVAGADAEVTLLLQPGHNEHTFDPTPKDIETAAKSKLGVMVGLGLDPWMEKLMKDAAPTAKIIKVGDRVPATLTIKDDPIGADDDDDDHDHDHDAKGDAAAKKDEKKGHDKRGHDDHDHEKGAPDPHVWLDPTNARVIVRAVAEELGKIDSPHALDYRKRGDEIEASLDALDKEAETKTKALKTRGFVTFHGSFSYFAARYKLSVLAVIEPFAGSQPTMEYIQKVLKVIKEKKVPALFSEPQLDARPAKIIADEAKIPLGVLDPVGGGPNTDTYEKMIRYDVAELEKYLK